MTLGWDVRLRLVRFSAEPALGVEPEPVIRHPVVLDLRVVVWWHVRMVEHDAGWNPESATSPSLRQRRMYVCRECSRKPMESQRGLVRDHAGAFRPEPDCGRSSLVNPNGSRPGLHGADLCAMHGVLGSEGDHLFHRTHRQRMDLDLIDNPALVPARESPCLYPRVRKLPLAVLAARPHAASHSERNGTAYRLSSNLMVAVPS